MAKWANDLDGNGRVQVRAISAATIKLLKLKDAVREEIASERNLLPEDPGWNKIGSSIDEVVDFCVNQLKAGYNPAPEVEIPARKPGHGVRPLPCWGLVDRIIYRAIANALLKKQVTLDRTPAAYVEFVGAPVMYANELQAEKKGTSRASSFLFGDSPIRYVVKSDITAFYQFVDHALLAEELLLLGADFEIIEALLDLLLDVQGRSYGLPQLLDASDALSEVFIDRVERDLLREGYAVWRFNDDFRIACVDYAGALAAVEALDHAARSSGLIINENKTVIVGFVNYMFATLGKEPADVGETISMDEVEFVIGDYTDEFGEGDIEAALEVISGATPAGARESGRDLRNMRMEDVRMIRRAINGVVKAKDPRALEYVKELAEYSPSVTPSIMRYLMKISDSHSGQVAVIVDTMIDQIPLNVWQRLWIIDTMRILKLMGESFDGNETRVRWVKENRDSAKNPLLRAVASRALASESKLSIDEVIAETRNSPSALLHFYTSAVNEAYVTLSEADQGRVNKAMQAFAKSSVIHRVLLDV